MLVKVDLMSRIEGKEITPLESLAIGEVARLSGKAPSAIRYYEEVGLVEAPANGDEFRQLAGRLVNSPLIHQLLGV